MSNPAPCSLPKRAMVISELLEHCRVMLSLRERYNWSEHIREKWRDRVEILSEVLEETLAGEKQ